MPVFRHTPFISGLLASAGERRRRARWAVRQPRRTWLYVARGLGVEENWRVVVVVVDFVAAVNRELSGSLDSMEDEEEERDVWEKFLRDKGDICLGRCGCRTRIVGLAM